MSSRGKKKRILQGREPEAGSPQELSDSGLSRRQDRRLEWFFGVIVFFGGGAFAGAELVGPLLGGETRVTVVAAGVCGAIGVCLAVVLLRRGETLF